MKIRTTLGLALGTAVLALLALYHPAPLVAQVQPYNYFVPPSQCYTSASGNTTGTQQQTSAGSSGTPVAQAQTSNSGTNTHTYRCNLAPPAFIGTTNPRIFVQDAVFFYGVQTSNLGVQVSTLASGTFNSTTVFTLINYPPPGGAETASTVAPVRADTGTMIINPAVGFFENTSTTAGSFYSIQFKPATPISWNVDLQQLLLNVTLQNTATSATITNSPGVLVHVRSQ